MMATAIPFVTVAILTIAALAGVVLAKDPSKTIDKRSQQVCGQWDTIQTGSYTIYQDLWGESSASSGSQCTTYDSLNGNTLVWSTSWTWAGGSSSVKSYANVVVSQSTGYQISSISSIPSVWDWR
jgi:xyloglucan-specific endo-beta-1,4-glucanase